MGRKKNSIALFEVISKTREKTHESGLDVPEWMGAGKVGGESQGASAPPSVRQPSRPGLAQSYIPPQPKVAVESGRIHLSVNYLTCGVVAAALAVLLVGAFLLGRGTAGTSSTHAGVGTTPALKSDVVPSTSGSGGAVATKRTTKSPLRVDGKYYLVIQNLMGKANSHKAEAQRIVAFCAKNGQPAELWTYKKSYIVWSAANPVDSPTSQAARDYALKIEKLGEKYFRKYRTYDFRQRNRSGQLTPMYLRYRKKR